MSRKIALSSLVFLLSVLPGAHAQDAAALKRSTAARAASVASLISNRIAREGDNGLLVVAAAQITDQARQLLTDENRDRLLVFKLIASQTGDTPDQVAALYAKRAMKLNPGSSVPNPNFSTTQLPAAACNDRELVTALKDRFANDEDLKAYSIQVDVTNKTVILSGAVGSDLERTRAGEVVRLTGCPVASVVNDLVPRISDEKIAAYIRKTYRNDANLSTQRIKVEVSRGNVVLSGSVCENIMRTMAASKATETHGVATVTNNLTIVPCSSPVQPAPVRSEGASRTTLSGVWIGSYNSCAQGQSEVQVSILESGPDDITASIEIATPNATPGMFTTHGVLNTRNNFLAFQFSGWQHQPPGLMMGNIGGYVTYTDQGPTAFTGIIKPPGCGQMTLRRR